MTRSRSWLSPRRWILWIGLFLAAASLLRVSIPSIEEGADAASQPRQGQGHADGKQGGGPVRDAAASAAFPAPPSPVAAGELVERKALPSEDPQLRREALLWFDPEDERFPYKREERSLVRDGDEWRETASILMVADQFLITFTGTAEAAGALVRLRSRGFAVGPQKAFSPVRVVRIPFEGLESFDRAREELRSLAGNGEMRVSPDYLARSALLPDDPEYALNQPDLDLVGAPAAWEVTTGSAEVVVAIIDTGIDVDHADLAGNLYANPGEIPGNAMDDDDNGLVDDVAGWDFYGEDAEPEDQSGHGTAMAGIIGAVGDNGIGIAGTAWQVGLLPLRAGFNTMPWSLIIEAMDYCVALRQNGVPVVVINASFAGPISETPEDSLLAEAVDRAAEAGLLIVAAAGNDGQDNDASPGGVSQHVYPSDFLSESILSVTYTTNGDVLSASANYGAVSVDMAAPGNGVLTTLSGGGYGSVTGSSAACARISGGAALLAAANPAFSAVQLKQLLMEEAAVLPDLIGKLVQPVRLDLEAGLGEADRYPTLAWMDADRIAYLAADTETLLQVLAEDGESELVGVAFFADTVLLGTDTDGSDGWTLPWIPSQESGLLSVTAIDTAGRSVVLEPLPFTALDGFDYWRFQKWGSAYAEVALSLEGADPDQDGLANLWEYAVGGEPLVASGEVERNGRPRMVRFEDAGTGYFGFDLRLRAAAADLEVVLETRTGAGSWEAWTGPFLQAEVDPADPAFRRIRIAAPLPVNGEERLLRLDLLHP
ncbi:MAG: S8 family serine peptidase [Verrucomicrobia bacterium]|jgi:hypothetical protein|nr:S8 family serine peptidase [Verrucomicrobiota bacterium]